MLRLLSILFLLTFFSCHTRNMDQEFECLETSIIVNHDHYDQTLVVKKKKICSYLFINIEADDPDLLDETMCVCPSLESGTCYSTGNLGSPFSQTIAIPIYLNNGCPGFEEDRTYIVGLGDEAPFANNNGTTVQLHVDVINPYTASSVITYYPETNTFSLDDVGSGITLEVLTSNWIC